MSTHHPYVYKVGHNYQAATQVDGERAASAGKHPTKAKAEAAAQELADILNSVWFEVLDEESDYHVRRAFHDDDYGGRLLIADVRRFPDAPDRFWVGIQEYPQSGLYIATWTDTEAEAREWAEAAGEVTWDHMERWHNEVLTAASPASQHRPFQDRLRAEIDARLGR